MESLQSLIDNMCANFTAQAIYALVTARLSGGPTTVGDVALDILSKDRSLDITNAQTLANAAAETLVQRGDIAVRDGYLYAAASTAR